MDDLLWHLGKIARLRFWYQVRHRGRWVLLVFIGLNSALSIFFLGLIAWLTSWPLIFPSLGPSVFLIFYTPSRAMSSPRNTLLGHLSAGIIGIVGLKLAHLLGLHTGLTLEGISILALTVGITGIFMSATRILHPPAASTALIASLGMLPGWHALLVLACACGIILIQAIIFHRLAGVSYPLWAPFKEDISPDIKTIDGNVSFFASRKRPSTLADMAEQIVFRGKVD